MNLAQLFALSLEGRAPEPALEHYTPDGRIETLTFGEVDGAANRMARALSGRGLGRGDRLCVYLANRAEFVFLYIACQKLGAIFVPINILYREREAGHIVRDAEPKGIVTAAEFPGEGPIWPMDSLNAEASAQPAERVYTPLEGSAPAALVYTSGTTGVSKGALLTHDNWAINATNLISCWRITPADRLLLPLPLFHVHGLGNGIHTWLIAGFRMRLLERFEHQRAAAEFADFQPTLFFGVPTIYVRLLDWPDEVARRATNSVRLFVSGSAPLAAQVLEDFRARFGHTILERYGMTETLMNIANPYEGERRPGTVGQPLPGVRVEIRDGQGGAVPAGTAGELFLKGPNVFDGYWRRPDATREAFQDGWFRTGDIGVVSEDGYYTLQGRRSDLIISGGFNIYPREIEEFLLEQPGIAEAAVAAAPDRVRGEVPVAYVVSPTGFDAAALEQSCRAALASFKVPRAFVRLDQLPRNALGKVQKHLLPPVQS